MIIDAHNHPDWYGFNFEKFIADMDEKNIYKTWLLSWHCPENEYAPETKSCFPNPAGDNPIPFENCVRFYERNKERFVLGFAPDPRKPTAIDELKSAVSQYGVKVCGEVKLRMMLDNPDAIRMFRFCGDEGLPVVIHLDYEYDTGSMYPRPNWWYGGGIDALERALKLCPETTFLGHAPGFWGHISRDDKVFSQSYPKGDVVRGGKVEMLLRKYPNLYCDISAGSGLNALSRDLNFTKDFLGEFQDRVLYARDYFDNGHQELLNSIGLDKEILDKIYFENAESLIK